jgi:hypothetical protein
MVEKLDLPFHLLSDPRGELIKHCDLWNDEEGASEPAIVALDKSGTVQYLYSGGTDFADRPQEESLLYILDRVGSESEEDYGGDEPGIQTSAEEAENETVRPDADAQPDPDAAVPEPPVGAVAVTRGGDGASWITTSERIDVEAQKVTVVDTIGAGDTFSAGLVDALWDDFERDRREVLAHGVRAAAVTVSRAGANPPTRAELEG